MAAWATIPEINSSVAVTAETIILITSSLLPGHSQSVSRIIGSLPNEAFRLAVLCQRMGASPSPRLRRVPVRAWVGCYFTGGTPRSLHIFLARRSSISVCLGTADRLFSAGFCHHEWREPSRRNSQPWERRKLTSSLRFIPRLFLPENPLRPPRGLPVY